MVLGECSDGEGWEGRRGVAVCWWEVVRAAGKIHQAKDDPVSDPQRNAAASACSLRPQCPSYTACNGSKCTTGAHTSKMMVCCKFMLVVAVLRVLSGGVKWTSLCDDLLIGHVSRNLGQ